MNNELSNLINNCQVCLTNRRQNSKQELIPHEIPDRAWAKVGIDLFYFQGKNFILVIDYFSKFIEIKKLHNTLADYVIDCLKDIFSRQGIPETVMSDNGPQFTSQSFNRFSREWGFTHITSSPHYPQSNGQVERAIQTVKNILKKTLEDRIDYRMALLEYLNTPISQNLASPAELLQSRKMRSILPTPKALLMPKVQLNTKETLKNRQLNQKQYYDRSAKSLTVLKVGQKVKIKNDITNKWISGIITEILKYRSYKIRLNCGRIMVRNRRHIIPDSSDRDDVPHYDLSYDDIIPLPTVNNSTQPVNAPAPERLLTNLYITRSGRASRPTSRYGIPTV